MIITGTSGDDTLTGTPGDDTIDALGGSDRIDAGPGNDVIHAGDGNDYLQGGSGSNTLYGGNGDDTFDSLGWMNHSDIADGGGGNDRFRAFWSTDLTITTGTGSDTIELGGGDSGHKVTVTDFTAGAGGDVLNISWAVSALSGWDGSTNPFAAGFLRLVQNGSDTDLQWDQNGATGGAVWTTFVTLQNVTASSLTQENFAPGYPPGGLVNAIPTITSDGGGDTTNLSVAENTTAVTTVIAADSDSGQSLSYSIVGGADAALFGIDTTTGALTFNTGPNFEAPTDAGGNNIYDVTVQVSDAHGGSDTQAVAVTVTDANEASDTRIVLNFDDLLPAIGLSPRAGVIPDEAKLSTQYLNTFGVSFTSGSSFVVVVDLGSGHATSGANGVGGATPEGTLTYSSAYPVTATFFDPSNPAVAATTDFVSLRGDWGGSGDSVTLNAYDINGSLIATFTTVDSGGEILSIAAPGIHSVQFLGTGDNTGVAIDDFTFNSVTPLTLSNNHAPVITTAATHSVAENTTLVAALTSTDADTVGVNPANFSITEGADAALFDIVGGNLVFKAAPNYETDPHSYQVEVSAFDGVNTTTKTITVNLTDVNEAPTAVALANATASILENTPTATHIKVADINVTDDALGSNILGLTGADAAFFEIVGSALYLKAGTVLDFESKTSYAVAVTVDDPTVGATPDATSTIYALNVSNVPGVTITGTSAANTIDATHTVAGQPLPTNEEDTINAGGGNDTINALGGNDFINGGAGADTMFGGTGNDTYVVDNGGDIVNETGGSGLDTVQSSITFSLSDAVHAIGVIENLTLTGTSKINGTGNAANNVITGNAGNNVLAGLGGADTLDGGAGTDTATYAASAAGVSVSLATGLNSGGDAEDDTLINFENLIGSAFADTLEGNGGNNVLVGGAGIDTISYEHAAWGVTVSLATTNAQNTGGAGTDTLSGFEDLIGSDFGDVLTGSAGVNVIDGGVGNDVIRGGGGGDDLTGGAGNDRFVLGAVTDSAPASDFIWDFIHGEDKLDFSAIDANTSPKAKGDQTFLFGGEDSHVAANSVTWFESAGHTIIQADVNGDASADLTITLSGTGLQLSEFDFFL